MITAQEARTRWGYVTSDDNARLDDEAAQLAAMVADGWHQIDAARALFIAKEA